MHSHANHPPLKLAVGPLTAAQHEALSDSFDPAQAAYRERAAALAAMDAYRRAIVNAAPTLKAGA